MLLQQTQAELNLTQTLLRMANATSELSELLFYPDTANDYDSIEFFTDEPDVSVVAQKDGYCYGIARATSYSIEDIRQNFVDGSRIVCSTMNESNCCTAKKAFVDAYDNSFRSNFENSLRECAANCTNEGTSDGCVVLGGMSQGAAIAEVASIILSDLNPYVMLLGQPETLFPDCIATIDPSRHYNFINSGVSGYIRTKIAYDKVYMIDDIDVIHYGHIILLSDDPTGVSYLGLNSEERFESTRGLRPGNAHTLRKLPGATIFGYSEHFDNILHAYSNNDNDHNTSNSNKLSYPVRETGFVSGTHCTKSIECESGTCSKSWNFRSVGICE